MDLQDAAIGRTDLDVCLWCFSEVREVLNKQRMVKRFRVIIFAASVAICTYSPELYSCHSKKTLFVIIVIKSQDLADLACTLMCMVEL